MRNHVLTIETLPQRVKDTEYSVRGPIAVRALQIQDDLKHGSDKYPFTKVSSCNIGNPQAVGQPPLTFHRQVLSCLLDPARLDEGKLPADVVARAKSYLGSAESYGAYSHSKGLAGHRKVVAEWLEKRDGFPADFDDVFLTGGASSAVRLVLECLIRDSNDGVMIPIPQYPLYSASITRLGGNAVYYYLTEEAGWSVDTAEMRERLNESREKGVEVRCLVIINPGNPTGTILREETLREIVQLCYDERLVLIADEVYQENVYGAIPFVSLRKVVREMGLPVECVSLHSASKGYYGECGLRGGLMHLENFDKEVISQMYKLASTALCPNSIGQAVMASLLSPPVEGDTSFKLFKEEKDRVLLQLKEKARMIEQKLNSLPGCDCQAVQGAMYAFPKLDLSRLPDPADGRSKDAVYGAELLEHTGIVAVPGCGFGNYPGTHHIRLTILPAMDALHDILQRFGEFHVRYTSASEN